MSVSTCDVYVCDSVSLCVSVCVRCLLWLCEHVYECEHV